MSQSPKMTGDHEIILACFDDEPSLKGLVALLNFVSIDAQIIPAERLPRDSIPAWVAQLDKPVRFFITVNKNDAAEAIRIHLAMHWPRSSVACRV